MHHICGWLILCLTSHVEYQVGSDATVSTVAGLYNDLGLIIFADPTGGPMAAMPHFLKATELHPKFPNAHFNAAVSSAKAGDHDKALNWFKSALELMPQNAMYYHQYGASLMEGKTPKRLLQAKEALTSAVQSSGNEAESYNLLGVVESRRKQYVDAAFHFKIASSLKPSVGTFKGNFATASLEAKNWNEAKEVFEQSLTTQPKSAEFYHGLAKALQGMDAFPHDRLKEAIPNFSNAAKIQPSNPQFHYDLCDAAFKIRDLKPAKEACTKGIALAGRYAPFHFLMGRVLEELGGQEALSMQHFSHAVNLDPSNKQYSFAYRSAAGAAGGGKGGLPSTQRQPNRMGQKSQPQATEPPSAASVGASDPELQSKIARLEAKLENLEEKVTGKIRNLYMMTEALTEKLQMISEKIDQGTATIINRIDRSDGVPTKDETIKTILPPGGIS